MPHRQGSAAARIAIQFGQDNPGQRQGIIKTCLLYTSELMEAIYRYFEQLRREKEQAAKTDIAEDVRNIESIDSDDPRFKSIE